MLCDGNILYCITLFLSFLINYLSHHIFCLSGIYVTTYVTPTISSLKFAEKFEVQCILVVLTLTNLTEIWLPIQHHRSRFIYLFLNVRSKYIFLRT
jgi:hypothetical protein